jgi:hypothetical protein
MLLLHTDNIKGPRQQQQPVHHHTGQIVTSALLIAPGVPDNLTVNLDVRVRPSSSARADLLGMRYN